MLSLTLWRQSKRRMEKNYAACLQELGLSIPAELLCACVVGNDERFCSRCGKLVAEAADRVDATGVVK